MALRNIVKIDEEKCNGCGLCINACAEGAIQLVNGKAKLISEIYCDGLGACIGHCPQDAITIEKRQAPEFDEQATKEHLEKQKAAIAHNTSASGFVCPGMAPKKLNKKPPQSDDPQAQVVPSQLTHWPIQLKLVPPNAHYFQNADLLLIADCVPFAMGDFHNKFLKGRAVIVGCPKLDDPDFYVQKLAMILKTNDLKSLTAIHMEVPCCFGLTEIAKNAIKQAHAKLPFDDVTISIEGQIKKTQTIT